MPAAPAPRNPSLSVSFILLSGSHFVFSIESQTGKEVVGVDEQHAKKKNVSDWVRTKALIFTLSESRKKSMYYIFFEYDCLI